jgi:hypothetical protein
MPPGRKMRTLLLAKRNHIMAKNTRFPISHQLDERLRAAVKNAPAYMSPELRAHLEKVRQRAAERGRSAQPANPKKPVRRKKGGGREPSFTPEEKTRLQGIYRDLLSQDSKLKKYSLAQRPMRRLLPKDKKAVSLRTLIRHVFSPVLKPTK